MQFRCSLAYYPSLNLEQVHATILYYLHNKEAVSQYVADWLEWSHQQLKAQQLNPSPSALRLRKLRAERKTMNFGNESQISVG
jgi:hypothetical protein